MLRTRAAEVSMLEAVLPEGVLRLPEELARVYALLEDPAFFAPFVPFFDPRLDRPCSRAADRPADALAHAAGPPTVARSPPERPSGLSRLFVRA